MSVQSFMLLFASGAALVALWIAVRLPSLVPERMSVIFAAAAAATLLPNLALPLVGLVAHHAGAVVALFTVAFPVAVFMFLAGAWTVLYAKKHLAPFRH